MRPINKDILKLALPSILANITVPIVGMVDIAVAGHLGTETGSLQAATLIGGISIGSMLFDLLYWNFGFLRAGTGGFTAQAFGRGDKKDCADNLSRGVGLAIIIAFMLLLIQWPFVEVCLKFISCSDEVRALARQYFFIRIWAAPATISLMAYKGWFIGMQDSISSMLTDLIVNGVNIAASVIVSFGLHIGNLNINGVGFPGVAIGTVVAQYTGFIFANMTVLCKYRKKYFTGYGLQNILHCLDRRSLRRFASVNGDLFIRSICLVIIYIGFTTLSARFGDLLLASSTIMMHLLLVFSYFTDGFAFAGEAMTGKFIGLKDKVGVRETAKWTFIWSMSIASAFVIVYALIGTPLVKMMTSDAAVVDISRQFIPWLLIMPLIGCPAFTWDGLYIGATASKAIRNSSLAAVASFFAVWFAGIAILRASDISDAATFNNTAIHILFGAYFAHLLARDIWQTAVWRREILGRPFES